MASKLPIRGLLRPTSAALVHPAATPLHVSGTSSSTAGGLLPVPPARGTAVSSACSFSTTSRTSYAAGRGGVLVFNWNKNPKMKKAYQKDERRTRSKVRKPASGDRKAFRKRIVLSNNSALSVDGLPELGPETLLEVPQRDLILQEPEWGTGWPTAAQSTSSPISTPTPAQASSTSDPFSPPSDSSDSLPSPPNYPSLTGSDAFAAMEAATLKAAERPPDPLERKKELVKIAQGMVSLPDTLVDKLRVLEAFKPTQSWGLFRKPHFLIREETTKVAQKMKTAVDNKDMLRMIIEGGKATGKSMLLLQAISYAVMNDWVVIHIPEAQDLTNGNTEYSPISNTNPPQFSQPVYITRMLERIYDANEHLLRTQLVSRPYRTELVYIAMGSTLADLASSIREDESSWPLFLQLWYELTAVPGRPPILLSADGLAHFSRNSAYRDPQFNIVHAHEMALPRLFLSALSPTGYGASEPIKFVNGGAVLTTVGGNNSPRIPALELALRQGLAITQCLEDIPQKDPFERGYDERVLDSIRGVDVMQVGGVNRDEARAVLEYWAASGLLRTAITEKVVAEKWTLGGSGVLGEMERSSLVNMRIPWV